MSVLTQIVFGDRTSAGRAAMDFAIAHGIPQGGWCPKWRNAQKELLKDFDTSKGIIGFQADKSLPTALVRKPVKSRIAENRS